MQHSHFIFILRSETTRFYTVYFFSIFRLEFDKRTRQQKVYAERRNSKRRFLHINEFSNRILVGTLRSMNRYDDFFFFFSSPQFLNYLSSVSLLFFIFFFVLFYVFFFLFSKTRKCSSIFCFIFSVLYPYSYTYICCTHGICTED